MIVKNEAQNLPRCLSSVQPYVDEMIIVDTGSTDESVAIAQQFGAQVSHFTWCNDFAAARNAGLSLATGEWILVLDADEELVVENLDLRQCLQASTAVREYSLLLVNQHQGANNQTPPPLMRLFRNLPGVQYVGCFHEHAAYAQPTPGFDRSELLVGVKIFHYGYAPELKVQKMRDRNIPLLESMRQRGELGLMRLTCLADMYEVTGNLEQSQACFQEAFDLLLPHLLQGVCPTETGYLRFLLYKIAWQTLEAENYETAQLLLKNGLVWFPNYPPLVYLAGLLLCYLGFYRGAIPYFQACLEIGDRYDQAEPFDKAYLTSHPAFSLGRCWMELRQWQEARAAFQLALKFDPDYVPAQERLAEIAEH
ncbi:MAG: glycosyltransferase [Aphanocapsa sp. GSE-SYN-MK-11-07L]|nr:glycosyltransferase [Aphanocapsa sp. GSE-SYN-MK-11-07L]